MMQNKLNNSFNMFTESTSSDQQQDVGNSDTVSPFAYKVKAYTPEIVSYMLDLHENAIKKIQDDIKEINKPLIHKLTKYKWILIVSGTILTAVFGFCFRLYNSSLEEKFSSLSEKIKSNSEVIQKNDESINNFAQRFVLLEYKIDGHSKIIKK